MSKDLFSEIIASYIGRIPEVVKILRDYTKVPVFITEHKPYYRCYVNGENLIKGWQSVVVYTDVIVSGTKFHFLVRIDNHLNYICDYDVLSKSLNYIPSFDDHGVYNSDRYMVIKHHNIDGKEQIIRYDITNKTYKFTENKYGNFRILRNSMMLANDGSGNYTLYNTEDKEIWKYRIPDYWYYHCFDRYFICSDHKNSQVIIVDPTTNKEVLIDITKDVLEGYELGISDDYPGFLCIINIGDDKETDDYKIVLIDDLFNKRTPKIIDLPSPDLVYFATIDNVRYFRDGNTIYSFNGERFDVFWEYENDDMRVLSMMLVNEF